MFITILHIIVTRGIEARIREIFLMEVVNKKIEDNEKVGFKNAKTVRIVTPDTNKTKSSLDESSNSKIVNMQVLILTELEKMNSVETWDRLKKPDACGNQRTPYDFFPNTCVALCEINRIGNEIKLVRCEVSILKVFFMIL